jgi:uncharacterized protein (DUF302 family)
LHVAADWVISGNPTVSQTTDKKMDSTMKTLAAKTKRLGLVIPAELEERLILRVAQETIEKKKLVTISEVVREAIEEYLRRRKTASSAPPP